jgi:hypothetical protein
MGAIAASRAAPPETLSPYGSGRLVCERAFAPGACRKAGAGAKKGMVRRSSEHLPAAYRLASWLLPPHRKEWAEAMLNEGAYIKSPRLAWQWAMGCALSAVKERVFYELGRTSMSRRLLRTLLTCGAVLVLGAVGIYVDSKPYQRERMWITLQHATHSTKALDGGR